MKRSVFAVAAGSILLVAGLCSVPAVAAMAAAGVPVARTAHTCAAAPAGYASCDAQVVLDSTGKPAAVAAPKGLSPASIRSAYALSALAGSGRIVAIVAAYNDPTAEADLGVYRKTYGLPLCTTANGCFRKVNQSGGSVMPRTDAGWATEISLDLDMVSAVCGHCRILLVQANSGAITDLAAAVNYAATQKVSAISNSYSYSDTAPNPAYDHPGIAITASTGDGGYGVTAPASYASVIAVGGTTLKKASNARGWTETAWSGAGSGCSHLNAKPSWQSSGTRCTGKAVADVSAVADPNTGVSVYDSTKYAGVSGWQAFGGTSAAAPIIAAVYAMSGNTAGYPAAYTWTHRNGLNDITTGTNGTSPTSRWSTATTGWDGPSGTGTPKGTSSF